MEAKIFIVGRTPNVSQGEIPIVVDDPDRKVSGTHCRISVVDGTYWIEDLGSTNGTFVNGNRLQGRQSIPKDSNIVFGGTFPFYLSHEIIRKALYNGKVAEGIRYDSSKNPNSLPKDNAAVPQRSISRISFGVVLLTLLVPFMLVKCNNETVLNIKGYELVIGKWEQKADYSLFSKSEPKLEQVVPPNIFAIGVYFLALIGFGMTFQKNLKTKVSEKALAITGMVLLVILMLYAVQQIKKEGDGMLHVVAGIGYYISLLAFASVLFLPDIIGRAGPKTYKS